MTIEIGQTTVQVQLTSQRTHTHLYVFLCACAGYGLQCHRAVITVCKLMGIKDMYCRVDGSINLLNITRALFTGLANQVRGFGGKRVFYGGFFRQVVVMMQKSKLCAEGRRAHVIINSLCYYIGVMESAQRMQ